MTQTATHAGEEIHVIFHAETERSDCGPGTPVHDYVNPDSISIHALTILGVDVDPRHLPADLVNKIHALTDELEFTT